MYSPSDIESKWQKYWAQNKTFRSANPPFSGTTLKKAYILDMFPYPSGAGLHVGHPKGYIATDVLARYLHNQGYNVLHPMGWDAFGLPAENYAIKTGTHPRVTTENNIVTYKKQLSMLGFAYDWDREIDTTDPAYYKWTQWIFLKLFERGLAYEQDLPINYCPSCKTGLANEEVNADNTCDRCGTKVERRPIRQWVLKITAYADRLLSDVNKLAWPEGIKEMQRNWIGKSEGVEFGLPKAVTNKPTALILHGWGGSAENGWKPWLKTRLEKLGYTVIVPNLPNSAKPNIEEQLAALEQYASQINEESLVIGHSLGAFLACHFVQRLTRKPKKIICVWPVFNGLSKVVDYSNLPGWKELMGYMENHYDLTLLENVKIHAYLSKDDTYIPYVDALSFFEKIGAEITSFENKGHFNEETGVLDFPEILGDIQSTLRVYTTRIDTVYGMTYAVIAPDHKDVNLWITLSERAKCEAYIAESKSKSDIDRTESKEKTGVFTGSYAINPFNNEKIPVYIGDYVLGSYGTGAVMAVPAHDERDFEFAKKHNLPIIESISGWNVVEKAFTEDGILVNSAEFNGLSSSEARAKFAEKAEKEGFGTKKVNYKLRDWLFSRQRYWGEPIPLIHLEKEDIAALPRSGNIGATVVAKEDGDYLFIDGKEFSKIYDGLKTKIVCDYTLPLELPAVEKYEPAGDGQSPLATVDSFVNVTLAENLSGKRETNTMPQWGGSCWYYLRYMDPKNDEAFVGKEAMEYWGEVDQYVGGAEHAVLHLLYARFWHKFLFDIGVVKFDEPFAKLASPGLILGSDGNKMSKSKGNVVNPDDVCNAYGTDTFRVYEMSMSEFREAAPWSTDAIIGSKRFLEKAWNLFMESGKKTQDDMKAMKLLHKTVKKVGEDIASFKFNTAITAINILLNEGVPEDQEFQSEWKEKVAVLLHPFAPHLAEELWKTLGHTESVYFASWPKYDEFMLTDDEVTIAVQVNGKLRGTFTFLNGVAQEEVSETVHTSPEIAKWVDGKTLVREIFVPNKLLNIVVKD